MVMLRWRRGERWFKQSFKTNNDAAEFIAFWFKANDIPDDFVLLDGRGVMIDWK